jgi:putative peptidoglycan lipid II flippase
MNIFQKSINLALISLLTSFISFFNQVLVAKYFGTSYQMDMYIIISNVPIFISALLSASINYSTTPFLLKKKLLLNECFSALVLHLFKKVFFYSFIIFSFISFITFCYLKFKSNVFNDNFTLNLSIYFLTWILSFFSVLNSLLFSILNSVQSFIRPLIINLFLYLFSILSVYLLHKSIDVLSITIGLLIGNLFGFFYTYYYLKSNRYFSNNNTCNINDDIKNHLSKLPLVSIAMLCFTIFQTIDSFWAPKLGISNLSHLAYCQRLIVAIGGFIIIGPSNLLLPRLAQSSLSSNKTVFLSDINLVIKIIISLTSLVALVFSIEAIEIVSIIFERGLFTKVDTIAVGKILPYMLFGMIFMITVVMLFRALFTSNNISPVIFLGLITTIMYFVISGYLSNYQGLIGIAKAYLITWILLFIITLLYIFSGNHSFFLNKTLVIYILKQAFLLFIITLFLYFYRYFLPVNNNSFFARALSLFFPIAVSIFLYFTLALKIIKQKEIIFLFSKLPFLKKLI